MNVVLDTHVLIWLSADSKRLSKRARHSITRAAQQGGLGVASISLWEIAQLASSGRLLVQGTVSDWIARLLASTGVAILELTPTIAELSTSLGPEFPRDPADRIIAA